MKNRLTPDTRGNHDDPYLKRDLSNQETEGYPPPERRTHFLESAMGIHTGCVEPFGEIEPEGGYH